MRGINVSEEISPSLALPHTQRIGAMNSQIPSCSFNTPHVTLYPTSLLDLNESNMSEFIQNWICSRNCMSTVKPVNQRFASLITIPVYTRLKLECNNLLKESNKQICYLEEGMHTITREEWCQRKKGIDSSLKKVNEITCTISDPSVIKGIAKRIRFGRKKRSKRIQSRTNTLSVIGGDHTNISGPKLNPISDISTKEVEQLISGIVKLRNLRLIKDNIVAESSTEFDDKVNEFRVQIAELK